jgi:hypothetical protein
VDAFKGVALRLDGKEMKPPSTKFRIRPKHTFRRFKTAGYRSKIPAFSMDRRVNTGFQYA